jgi:hypothetical protein
VQIESTSLALLRMLAVNLKVPFEVARSAYVDAVPGAPTFEGWCRIVRHGEMTDEFEHGRWKAKVVKVPRSGYRPPVASAEAREDYDFEMRERAFKYMDAGLSEERAFALVKDEMACPEVWDLLRGWSQGAGEIRGARSLRVAGFCSRCESIGHQVVRCPFPDELKVRQVAEARRSRRRKAVAA